MITEIIHLEIFILSNISTHGHSALWKLIMQKNLFSDHNSLAKHQLNGTKKSKQRISVLAV